MKYINCFSGKRVLITGNTGFKGSWLTAWLLSLNAEVFGISNLVPTSPSLFKELDLQKKIQHSFLDIRDFDLTKRKILEIKPDFLFHLAAQPIVSESFKDPLGTLTTNIIGTANVLEVMRGFDHECVGIFISSDKCYENIEQIWGYREKDPLGGKDVYSASKGAAEIVFHSYFRTFFKDQNKNIRMASARAGNVIGGGDFAKDRIIPDCFKAWSRNKKVNIRQPYSIRPWQFVLEPLGGYLQLAALLRDNQELNGESFNFGPKVDQNENVINLVSKLALNWGFASPDEAFTCNGNTNYNEAGCLKLDCEKANVMLNWKSKLDYIDTIDKTGDWYRKFYQSEEEINSLTIIQIKEYERIAFS
jgi:CDP-glucose 4,6-dehydratase